jgi:hypothetical protein
MRTKQQLLAFDLLRRKVTNPQLTNPMPLVPTEPININVPDISFKIQANPLYPFLQSVLLSSHSESKKIRLLSNRLSKKTKKVGRNGRCVSTKD